MTDPKPPTHERGPPHGNLALQFDAQEFAHFLAHTDLTEDQKTEYIHIVWRIMCAFVDLGWGVNSIPFALPEYAEISSDAPGDELDCFHHCIEGEFEAVANGRLEREES
ncbi:MAG: hypothetical protein IPH06_02650 [Alphaproteobacteria bacterium]|nr:hypothetical protein [Alphaproteobacteria bacterium]QQS56944.1 MAG: hypothetical protein IPN28_11905 [Alphaproteobacteria bacterium]